MIVSKTTSDVCDRIIRTIGSIGLSVFIVVRRCAGLNRCREISYPATRTPTGIPVVRAFHTVFTIALLSVSAFGATEFPSELRLANGATLRKCEAVRWTAESVVVRHAGGIDPIRFVNIAPDQRAAVQAARSSQPVVDKPKTTAPVVPSAHESDDLIEGQAFIVTQGAGSYKLGGMAIYAFPAEKLSAFDGFTTVDLGEPIGVATTDADGKFKMKLPDSGPFFLFARGERTIWNRQREFYEWVVRSEDIKDRSSVTLSSANRREPARIIKIGNETLPGRGSQIIQR